MRGSVNKRTPRDFSVVIGPGPERLVKVRAERVMVKDGVLFLGDYLNGEDREPVATTAFAPGTWRYFTAVMENPKNPYKRAAAGG